MHSGGAIPQCTWLLMVLLDIYIIQQEYGYVDSGYVWICGYVDVCVCECVCV